MSSEKPCKKVWKYTKNDKKMEPREVTGNLYLPWISHQELKLQEFSQDSSLIQLTDEENWGTAPSDMEIKTNESQTLEIECILLDLKNTRISESTPTVLIGEATGESPARWGNRVVVNCPELRQFFKVSCFEVKTNSCSHTQSHQWTNWTIWTRCPKGKICIHCKRKLTQKKRWRWEWGNDRSRILEKTGHIHKTLSTLHKCIIWTKHMCKKFSPDERIKACALLEPNLSDVLSQMDAVMVKFVMKSEMPALTPHGHIIKKGIQNDIYCGTVWKYVQNIYDELHTPQRDHELDLQHQRKQPLLPTTAQLTTPIQSQPVTTNISHSNYHNLPASLPEAPHIQPISMPTLIQQASTEDNYAVTIALQCNSISCYVCMLPPLSETLECQQPLLPLQSDDSNLLHKSPEHPSRHSIYLTRPCNKQQCYINKAMFHSDQ